MRGGLAGRGIWSFAPDFRSWWTLVSSISRFLTPEQATSWWTLVSSISRFLTPEQATRAASGADVQVVDSRHLGGA